MKQLQTKRRHNTKYQVQNHPILSFTEFTKRAPRAPKMQNKRETKVYIMPFPSQCSLGNDITELQ